VEDPSCMNHREIISTNVLKTSKKTLRRADALTKERNCSLTGGISSKSKTGGKIMTLLTIKKKSLWGDRRPSGTLLFLRIDGCKTRTIHAGGRRQVFHIGECVIVRNLVAPIRCKAQVPLNSGRGSYCRRRMLGSFGLST